MFKRCCYILTFTFMLTLFSACGNQNTNSSVENNLTDNTVVATQFGQVAGNKNGDVITYYGVPYAKNPVDELRWSYPEDPENWNDVLNCTEKEEIALQMQTTYDENGKPSTSMAGTTDCLNLDIYTKSNSENLPVIVYIHGGNNQTGSSFEIPGTDLVKEQDVVYVSVNYRLGLLGFNCLPAVLDENESGNFGLMDIKKSLEWVKANIQEFGGDPNNITISGFSAGGRDVMTTLISPEFEGLYEKAIVYSGGMTVANLEQSQNKIAEIMSPLAIEDGKATTVQEATNWLLQDTDEVKNYLLGLDDSRIVSLLGDAGIRMSKFPHLYGDDITIPSTGFENATYVQDVPSIMLTGTDEFSLFTTFDSIYNDFGENSDLAKQFAITYGSDFYRIFNTQLSAEKMSKTYNSDIYLCEIEYGGKNSECKIDNVGSFHGIFVPMLSSEHGYSSFHDFNNENYQAMSNEFIKYIINFVNTGNPNGDNLTDWNPWTFEDKNTMLFDADESQAITNLSDKYKTNNDIIAELTADTSISDDIKSIIISSILNGRWFSTDIDNTFSNETGW